MSAREREGESGAEGDEEREMILLVYSSCPQALAFRSCRRRPAAAASAAAVAEALALVTAPPYEPPCKSVVTRGDEKREDGRRRRQSENQRKKTGACFALVLGLALRSLNSTRPSSFSFYSSTARTVSQLVSLLKLAPVTLDLLAAIKSSKSQPGS